MLPRAATKNNSASCDRRTLLLSCERQLTIHIDNELLIELSFEMSTFGSHRLSRSIYR